MKVTIKVMSTDATLLPDPEALPDDPALLKQLICQLLDELGKQRQRSAQLEHRLDLLLRRVYGRTSEKLDPRQATLFDATGTTDEPAPPTPPPAADEPPPSDTSSDRTKRRTPGHGRRPKADTTKLVEVVHDLTEAEKVALGGADQLVLIGKVVTHHYDFEPSSLLLICSTQMSYARKEQLPESGELPTEKNVITAPKPPLPIPGGIAGPGLLAQTIVNKYFFHLPLARQEPFYGQYGMPFSRKTMCDWCLASADLFAPLIEIAADEVRASRVVGTDDTTVKIRDARQKEQYTGRFWPYRGDADHPLTVFDYTADHSRDGPARFLQGYQGFLQADAANLYDQIFLKSDGRIIEVGCWAHARRKFHEVRDLAPLHAQAALVHVHGLYAIERELRKRCAGDWSELDLEKQYLLIAAERQARSRPLLEQFCHWLEAMSPKLIPSHPVRGAVDYALNHWQALCRYTEDGRLSIDNNAVEGEIRRLALGRKNWLFCGSDRGARAAATHFSLITSCVRNGIAPFTYLRDLLRRLPLLGPGASRVELRLLLPDRWHPA